MNDQQFDKVIQSAMEHMEAPYDASSWELLSQKMDSRVAPEEIESNTGVQVDQAMFSALSDLEVPYNQMDWAVMNSKLNAVGGKKRILWYKIGEIAAILLLLFGWFQYMTVNNSRSPIRRLHQEGPVADASLNEVAPDLISSVALAGKNAIAAVYEKVLEVLPVNANPATSMLASADLSADNLLESPSGPSGIEPVDFMPTKAPGQLVYSERAPSRSPIVSKAARRSDFYVLEFGSVDRNTVQIAGNRKTRGGYSAGLAFGYHFGKWGVEAGAAYSSKAYTPKKELEIYSGNLSNGYFGSTLTDVDADMLVVPVKVSRRVAQKGRTTVHAIAGVSANIAMQKAYHYQTLYFPGTAPSSQSNPDQEPERRLVGKGVLESGQLADNFYVAATGSVRIEHALNSRYSAFIEPSYSAGLGNKSFGPKPVGMNTFAVSLGLIATL